MLQETCNMKNHMIEYLRNNGVQIYERPQKHSKVCQLEWDTFGRCCEEESLHHHLKQKRERNQQALVQLREEIRSIHGRLVELREVQIDRPLKQLQDELATLGSGLTLRENVNPNSSTVKQTLKSLDKNLLKIQQNSEPLIQGHEKCVQSVNEINSKSACSICSGRSDDFFNKDGKLKFTERSCRRFLGDCEQALNLITGVAVDARIFGLSMQQLRKSLGLPFDVAPKEISITMNLDSFITNRNLIPIMNKCGKRKLQDCSFEHVAALCEQFIHIQAQTYIESSQSQY